MKSNFYPVFAIVLSTATLNAAEFWDGSESSTFSDVNNWNGASPPASLAGASLTQDSNAGNAPVHSSGSVAAQSYVFGPSGSGVGQTTTLTLNGGSLSTNVDFEVATGRDNHNATVNISNGSVLTVGSNLDNIDNNATGTSSLFTLNVLSGGTIQGVNNMRGDVDVNVSAGSFLVGGTVGAASTTTFGQNAGWQNNDSDLVLSGTGQVVFDVFGVGSNDTFVNNAAAGNGTFLDLTGGSVVIALDGGYDPTLGDSFDFLSITISSYFSASAANVENSLITGGANAGQFVQWDTTDWESSGILSVGAIVVPEPSSYGLLAGFSALAWIMLRRRR